MKYSEANGEWVYDWPTIIDDLEAGAYDKRQKQIVIDAACNWVTCACGNQCASIPRNDIGVPLDYELDQDGERFGRDIIALAAAHSWQRHRKAEYARETLKNIEQRSAELLKELS